MNRNFKQFFTLLWRSLLFWTIALGLFGVFRYNGLSEVVGITLGSRFEQIGLRNIIMSHMFIGVLLGILYAITDFVFEKTVSKKLSLGLRLFFRTIIYFFVTTIVFTIAIEIISEVNQLNINNSRGWWRANRTFWTIVVYLLLCSLVFSIINIALEKFGKGVFLKMLLGRYKNPREEKRIFMFLDLKSSTAIAEELGHLKYSQLIQDCFFDLNVVVPKFDAEIYQYVGDEAVLCWPYEKGLKKANCVKLYFAFMNQKLTKSDYYMDKYGMIPQFKAGLHGGVLMVAEVGVIKKELAYHGDVINTSARIQAECNNLNVPILISEALLNDLGENEFFKSTSLGAVLLKGKNKEINIYTLSQS